MAIMTCLRIAVLSLLVQGTSGKYRGDIVRAGTMAGGHMVERGFVTCVSGQDDQEVKILEQSIRRLRALGNPDPIEVFHVATVSEEQAKPVTKLSRVTVVDLTERITKKELAAVKGDVKKYRPMCRTMAILHTTFSKVAWFNHDVTFFKNPHHLWSFPSVDDSGMLFFHERPAMPKKAHLKRHSKLCNDVEDFAAGNGLTLMSDFRSRHHALCRGNQQSVQSSAVLFYDQSKPSAQKALKMLKTLHIQFLVTGKLEEWHIADKELPWIAAELSNQTGSMFSSMRPQYLVKQGLESPKQCYCGVQGDPESEDEVLYSEGYAIWSSECSESDSVTTKTFGYDQAETGTNQVCSASFLKEHKKRPLNEQELAVLRSFSQLWI